jgi:hypothetical protein
MPQIYTIIRLFGFFLQKKNEQKNIFYNMFKIIALQ